ncbi:MFS transporter [Streptomyces capparidis]
MLTPYRAIFAAPGAKAFSAAGLVARMPLSMLGIGIVTMVSELTGEYGTAGALAATLAVSFGLIGPQVSRLVDRFGQRRVLRPAMLVTVAAVTALVLCASLDAPTWTLFVCTAVAGCTPSIGSMVRARWAHLYGGTPQLHTAYSFEAVLDEVCFIVGPVLSIGLSTAVLPAAGPILAVGFLAVGVFAITAQRATEPPPHPVKRGDTGSALRSPGLRMLVGTFVATGAIFGSIEVITVAFAEEKGHKAASSLVLAAYALGSCLAGIAFGLLRPKGPEHRRFLIGVAALSLSMVPLLLVNSLVTLGVAVFVSGLSIAPTMVTTMALVERLVPRARLTEGMTWVSTGLAGGVALGASVAGRAVDETGAADAFAVPAAAGALTLLLALFGVRHLVPKTAATRNDARQIPGPGAEPPRRAGSDASTGGQRERDGDQGGAGERGDLEQLGG